MVTIICLSLLAPIVIYLGLNILNNVSLTFIMFYGFVCVIIPVFDLIILKKYTIHRLLTSLGFLKFKKSFLFGAISGLLFSLIIYIFFTSLNEYVLDIDRIDTILYQWKITNINIYLFLIIMIFANSILEEIFWRGYIYYKLMFKTKIVKVVLLTSLFYTSYHFLTTINLFPFYFSLLFTFIIFCVGVFWGYLRYKYQSLYITMISHLFADLGIMSIYFIYFS